MLAQAECGSAGEHAMCPYESCLRIGGVSLALRGTSPNEVRLSRELDAFTKVEKTPNIEVNTEWVGTLQPWRSNPVFDSGALWTLFRDGPELVFDFTSPAFGDCPYKRLRTDENFRHAQLLLNRDAMGNHDDVYPLEYPADELLITNYLASGLGVEVHGCGIVDAETGGHLFLGHSGAGKSTSTMLWKSLRKCKVLSDDRVILRLHNGELWMYGTPWHGEAAFASAGSAKLSKIFILQHGHKNVMVRMPRSLAVGEMFARSFPPFHSALGLERTLEFLTRVADAVPCYAFEFLPDNSAVQAMLDFRHS
jgi:hypothetical protein